MSEEDRLAETIKAIMETIRLLGEAVSIHSESLRIINNTVSSLDKRVSDMETWRVTREDGNGRQPIPRDEQTEGQPPMGRVEV